MNKAEKIFLDNIRDILGNGSWDRNPRPVYSDGVPAYTKFITDVFEKYEADEVPITEARRIAWKTSIRELMWIYQDQTTELQPLRDRKVFYWDDWKLEGTDHIGSVYGMTVGNHNLMNNLLEGLEKDPFGRRHLINLWQEEDFKKPHGLKPCAFLSMYSVRENPRNREELLLDASLTIRSSDYLTAGHINRVQYKALQMMIAKHLGYGVGTFSVHTKNMHIYDRHSGNIEPILSAINKIDKRDTRPEFILDVPDKTNFYDIKDTDFVMKNYYPVKHEPKLEFDLGI